MLNKIFQSIDIGAIISERLTAFKKLQENPNDIDAVMTLGKVQEKVQAIALLPLINDLFQTLRIYKLIKCQESLYFKENVKDIYISIWELVNEFEKIKRNFLNFNYSTCICRLVCGLSPKIFQASSWEAQVLISCHKRS